MSDKSPDNLSPGPGEHSRDTLEQAAYRDQGLQDVHAQLAREKEEPTEGFSPVPIFLLFLFGGLIFWGGIYFTQNSGNFRADVFDPDWTPGAEATAEVVFDPIARGKRVYMNCQACHQPNGLGVPGAFPPLDGSRWVTESKERVVKILLHGLNGPIEVKGNTYNGAMPAFAQLSDRDIAAVLTYIRQEWGNSAEPIPEELVTSMRAETGERAAWTGDELLALYPMD